MVRDRVGVRVSVVISIGRHTLTLTVTGHAQSSLNSRATKHAVVFSLPSGN